LKIIKIGYFFNVDGSSQELGRSAEIENIREVENGDRYSSLDGGEEWKNILHSIITKLTSLITWHC
jgi:hypothetical protein